MARRLAPALILVVLAAPSGAQALTPADGAWKGKVSDGADLAMNIANGGTKLSYVFPWKLRCTNGREFSGVSETGRPVRIVEDEGLENQIRSSFRLQDGTRARVTVLVFGDFRSRRSARGGMSATAKLAGGVICESGALDWRARRR